jgi:hypothetical protein
LPYSNNVKRLCVREIRSIPDIDLDLCQSKLAIHERVPTGYPWIERVVCM